MLQQMTGRSLREGANLSKQRRMQAVSPFAACSITLLMIASALPICPSFAQCIDDLLKVARLPGTGSCRGKDRPTDEM
jgi:hypothetical protein